jgi:hypothetical protein
VAAGPRGHPRDVLALGPTLKTIAKQATKRPSHRRGAHATTDGKRALGEWHVRWACGATAAATPPASHGSLSSEP